jgi:hypothetical protein
MDGRYLRRRHPTGRWSLGACALDSYSKRTMEVYKTSAATNYHSMLPIVATAGWPITNITLCTSHKRQVTSAP